MSESIAGMERALERLTAARDRIRDVTQTQEPPAPPAPIGLGPEVPLAAPPAQHPSVADEALRTVERELTALYEDFARAAESLREDLDAAPGPEVEPAHEPKPADAGAAAPAPEAAPTERATVEVEPAPSEPEPEPEPELSMQSATVSRSQASTLVEEARSRVAGKSDIELAELHRVARGRGGKGSDEEQAYWSALTDAAVAEAADRPRFGEFDDDSSVGRRERKRRARAFRPLMDARAERRGVG